jgi:hypothetical protein
MKTNTNLLFEVKLFWHLNSSDDSKSSDEFSHRISTWSDDSKSSDE